MDRRPEFFHESLVITAPRHALRRWPGIAAIAIHALLGGGIIVRSLCSFEKLAPPEIKTSARFSPPPVIVKLGDGRPPGARRETKPAIDKPRDPRPPRFHPPRSRTATPPVATPEPEGGKQSVTGDPSLQNGTEGDPNGDPDGDPNGRRNGVIGGVKDANTPPSGVGPEILREFEVPLPPVLRVRVDPAYPEMARQQGMEGVVVLELVVDERGNVIDARVTRSDNTLFNDAAIRAVRRWKYSSARAEGRSVRVYKAATIQFRLH